MQTNFSDTQLKDKDNQSTEKIFKKCVHCGMCNVWIFVLDRSS